VPEVPAGCVGEGAVWAFNTPHGITADKTATTKMPSIGERKISSLRENLVNDGFLISMRIFLILGSNPAARIPRNGMHRCDSHHT
jgi:hypothetical protein